MNTVWIGVDPRELDAYAVTINSLAATASRPVPTYTLRLDELRARGLYYRPSERRDGILWDSISDAPCSTEFAISRFLVPELAGKGWALFVDSDMLLRDDINNLFALADDRYAVMCVKHHQVPVEARKMDDQPQTVYPRKNWSSVMLFNCDHPSNARLTVEYVNKRPGRDLHRFDWLADHEIGELPLWWNYLSGVTEPGLCRDPSLVHFTLGVPSMAGCGAVPFAEEWWTMRHKSWSELMPFRAR